LSRRKFIAAGGATVAGSILAPALSFGSAADHNPAPSRRRDKMRMAIVGTGVRGITMWGRSVAEEYADHVEIVGLCDINPGRVAHAKEYIGVDCPTFTDFDEMLRTVNPQV